VDAFQSKGNNRAKKELQKLMQMDAEKAWDAKVVELWLIANLKQAFGGASIIDRKCHIGLLNNGGSIHGFKKRCYF